MFSFTLDSRLLSLSFTICNMQLRIKKKKKCKFTRYCTWSCIKCKLQMMYMWLRGSLLYCTIIMMMMLMSVYGWACLHSCQPNNLTKISKLIACAFMKMKNYSLKYNVCQLAIHLWHWECTIYETVMLEPKKKKNEKPTKKEHHKCVNDLQPLNRFWNMIYWMTFSSIYRSVAASRSDDNIFSTFLTS